MFNVKNSRKNFSASSYRRVYSGTRENTTPDESTDNITKLIAKGLGEIN